MTDTPTTAPPEDLSRLFEQATFIPLTLKAPSRTTFTYTVCMASVEVTVGITKREEENV